jgi:mannose-1-phosphate guanylyltransferase
LSLHAVILAGGSGTRFWPLSRVKRPKQFLALSGTGSLISETLARIAPVSPPGSAWVVCGKDHAALVQSELPSLLKSRLVVEPAARNTAPAIGLAAIYALKADPDATLAVLPSDHVILKSEEFRRSIARAAEAAQDGTLITLGIKPIRAETGYGYLHRGAARGADLFAVQAFVEKPDAKTAEKYLADPSYAWNAGIFVFRADAILAAIERNLPALHEGLKKIAASLGTSDEQAALQEIFPRLPSISIDYGVMEPEGKAGRIALVPGDFGWSDVGSFAALPEVRALDERGNLLEGDALAVDCDNSILLGQKTRLLAAVGLKDLIVVDAGDTILVLPRGRAQDVRAVVEALKAAGRTDQL